MNEFGVDEFGRLAQDHMVDLASSLTREQMRIVALEDKLREHRLTPPD